MDKSSAQDPSGSLQVNGLLSPPLTPDPNHRTNNNAMGIIDGVFDNTHARPPSPNPSVSSSFGSSSDPRPSSTFTAASHTSSQTAASSPDLSRDDPHPLPPIYAVHDEHNYTNSKPSPTSPTSAHRNSTKPRSFTDGRQDAPFPRLSKPVELLRSAYDVVVIGSGYGGGVAASRMARTGQSVCLLERGREKWPGEYPSGAIDATKELHYSGTFSPGWIKGKQVEGGDPTGLYHLIMGRGQSAVVGNGEFLSFLSEISGTMLTVS
jgi:hypothetical protein